MVGKSAVFGGEKKNFVIIGIVGQKRSGRGGDIRFYLFGKTGKADCGGSFLLLSPFFLDKGKTGGDVVKLAAIDGAVQIKKI